MGQRIMTKDDWRNTMVLIRRGIEDSLGELSDWMEDDVDLIANPDEHNYVMDRMADIQSGYKALRWITRKVVN